MGFKPRRRLRRTIRRKPRRLPANHPRPFRLPPATIGPLDPDWKNRIPSEASDEERFDALIDRLSGDRDCWIWMGPRSARDKIVAGYGVFYVAGKRLRAHRYCYERSFGPIPDGSHIDHLCQVTLCVNPAHLEAVTPEENLRRAGMEICSCPACGKGMRRTIGIVRRNDYGLGVCRRCRDTRGIFAVSEAGRPATADSYATSVKCSECQLEFIVENERIHVNQLCPRCA